MNNTNNALDRILERLELLTRIASINTGLSMGINGHDYFTSSDNLAGKRFCAIAASAGADAQVDYTVVQDDGTEIAHSNITLVDGAAPLVGNIIKVNVDSGTILAYFGLDYK